MTDISAPVAHQLFEMAETIWSSMLDLSLMRTDAAPDYGSEPRLSACVHLTGDWEGAVLIHCTAPMAQRIAAVMFEIDDAGQEETQDALGELVNVLAGNAKAILPGSPSLSLPTVMEGRSLRMTVPSSIVVASVTCVSEQQRVDFALVQRAKEQRTDRPPA